ncbi:MAG: alpha/beta fold hydrolase [Planctomycetota bacterium]
MRGEARAQAAPLVVCVHGWCADGSYFDAFRRAWPGDSIAVDLPGHGRAGWNGEASVEELGAALALTVDGLAAPNVVWVGHGLGGAVALSAAARCSTPSLGLLALDCLHDLDRELPAEQWGALVEAYRTDFPGTLRSFAKQAIPPGTLEPRLAASIADDLVLQERDAALAILAALPAATPAQDRAASGLPIHAVLADLDQAVDAEGNGRTGVYTFAVLPRSGHFLQLERPDELASILEAQLAAWDHSSSR